MILRFALGDALHFSQLTHLPRRKHLRVTGFTFNPGLHRLFFRRCRKNHRRCLTELIHVIKHGSGRQIPIIGCQGHCLANDLLQARGDIGIILRRLLGATVDMLNSNIHRCIAIIGNPSCNHLIHHNTQGINIRAVIHPAALGLLRRDIMHRPQRFRGQSTGISGSNLCNTEISHLHRTVFQHHHIMGLNVTMDNAPAMRMLQRLGDLNSKMQCFLPIQNALALHILLQANAVNQLHDDKIRLTGAGHIVNRYNIGVTQCGDYLALRMKTIPEFSILRIFIFQNFYRHQPI